MLCAFQKKRNAIPQVEVVHCEKSYHKFMLNVKGQPSFSLLLIPVTYFGSQDRAVLEALTKNVM